jgi:hypothetical protein
MIDEIVKIIFGIIILIPFAWVVWESSVMLAERKARYRAGTHDYYDNPIVKETDETIS